MARTVIDLDEAAWRAAAEELGTTTKVETVNKALRLIAARRKRLAFLEHLDTLAADLSDDEVMRGAWR
ncbi:MAG: type II toxin-antitoxin system VapB family antitoxin [Egibacteraceae bacterium]